MGRAVAQPDIGEGLIPGRTGTLDRVVTYLDHAAGAPLHPLAAAAMTDWLERGAGNPSGSHSVARRARAAIEEARDVLAAFMGVEPSGVVFTSGGTEADNLAVFGAAASLLRGGPTRPILVSAVEHPAVTEAARALSAAGAEVRTVGVGADGVVDTGHLTRLLTKDVRLVSVQAANHETGVLQPIEAVARRLRRAAPDAVLHTDAVQAAGWLDLPEVTAPADLVSISGHKFGGPQGIGALGIRTGVEVAPVLHGGGQEQERRSGTQNVAAIVGLAAAADARRTTRREAARSVARLRDRLAAAIESAVPGAVRTAPGSPTLPGHCHFRFPGVESEELIFLLDERGVCASAGAACASGATEPSPVLLAMGVPKEEARSALRLTLGPATTEQDVVTAAAAVAEAVARLRGR